MLSNAILIPTRNRRLFLMRKEIFQSLR